MHPTALRAAGALEPKLLQAGLSAPSGDKDRCGQHGVMQHKTWRHLRWQGACDEGSRAPLKKEIESDMSCSEVIREHSIACRSKRINERHVIGSTDLLALPILCLR